MEHFVAAAFSVQHSRSMDGIRMVVPGCIAAVADAVMRKIATDIPSEVCVHLMGGIRAEKSDDATVSKTKKKGANRAVSGQKRKGFGLSTGEMAKQSAIIEVFAPEV